MKLSRALALPALIAVMCGCSTEPEAMEGTAPPQALVETASPSPSIDVDPTSVRFICEKLRLRDAYLKRDSLSPVEEEQVIILELEAIFDARLEDAEPALRKIAQEHIKKQDVTITKMIEWCKENTEPLTDTSPW